MPLFLCLCLSAAGAEDFFTEMDVDGDGLISFGEYLVFTTLLAIPKSEVRLCFEMLDADQSGYLDRVRAFARMLICAVADADAVGVVVLWQWCERGAREGRLKRLVTRRCPRLGLLTLSMLYIVVDFRTSLWSCSRSFPRRRRRARRRALVRLYHPCVRMIWGGRIVGGSLNRCWEPRRHADTTRTWRQARGRSRRSS